MAEDDDDEAFGDFAFAPFQINSKSTAPNSSDATEDDEWGDFVTSPQQSNASAPSPQGDRVFDKTVSSPQWVKPSGALPLSIFGDAGEEEEGSSGDWGSNQEKSGVNGDFNSSLAGKGASNPQKLSIADLYNRYVQITPDQRRVEDTSVDNEADLRSNQNESGSDASGSKNVDLDDEAADGNDDSQLKNKSQSKESGIMPPAQDTSKGEDPFGSWTMDLNGVGSYSTTKSPNPELSSTGVDVKDQNQQLDGSDNSWEFKDSRLELPNEKLNHNEVAKGNPHSSVSAGDSSKSHDAFGMSNGSFDFFLPSTGSIDDFHTSNEFFSTTSKEVDFFGDARNGWTYETKANTEQTNTKGPLNHSPDIGNEEFDEDFGEFTAASAETEAKPQEAYTNDVLSPSKCTMSNSDGKFEVDFMVPDVSKGYENSPQSVRGLNKSHDMFGASNGSTDFFASSAEPVDFFATSTSKGVDLFAIQSRTPNGFSSDTNSITEQSKIGDSLNHAPDFSSAEDEDFGEFTSAAAESGPKLWEGFKDEVHSSNKDAVQTWDGKTQVDLMSDGVFSERSNSFTSGSDSKKPLDLFGMTNRSTSSFGTSTKPTDFFTTSNVSSTSQDEDLNGAQASDATFNGPVHKNNAVIGQNSIEGTLNHSPEVEDLEFDDDFGDFTAASAENGSLTMEKDSEKSNLERGAIPISIFGTDEPYNEEPQSSGSSDVQDVIKFQSTPDKKDSNSPSASLSLNDLISSLYSQAEQSPSIIALEKPSENEFSFSSRTPSSSPGNDVDQFEDSIWDLKDVHQASVGSEIAPDVIEERQLNISSHLKFSNTLDFYLELKEQLCFVIKHHIEQLKHAGSDAALFGEDESASSLDHEFQLVCKELEQLKLGFKESNFQEHPPGESLKKFVGVLLEPQFQILESDYHLSDKLLQAENDAKSAMELIRHATAMLKILTVGTSEERKVYFSVWCEMISTCARELRHGASIWIQAVEKHVQSLLLSEPQGMKFFLALGEIYRVIAVLGASAELYKPWISLDLIDFPAISPLLEECHTVWSSSGLEEALSNETSSTDTTSLVESIKYVRSLDALALQNYVYAGNGSMCQLSLLTAELVPGMKMVLWENHQCFVTLANLWANLISRNPPELPQLNLS